jgi:hypothetical protein
VFEPTVIVTVSMVVEFAVPCVPGVPPKLIKDAVYVPAAEYACTAGSAEQKTVDAVRLLDAHANTCELPSPKSILYEGASIVPGRGRRASVVNVTESGAFPAVGLALRVALLMAVELPATTIVT